MVTRWVLLACIVGSAGCTAQSQFTSAAIKTCSRPQFAREFSDCVKIATISLDAIAYKATPQALAENLFTALRPYSPYGPTSQGWKGISPGRTPGETGANSLADGVMQSVQLTTAIAQLKGEPYTAEDLAKAIGKGLTPP